jgi:Short repeat of unknown function (DUF308)
MAATTPALVGRHGSTLSILWGVLLVLFGFIAIGAPFLAAVAVSAVVAWLIVLAGIVHVAVAFHSHGAGSVIWKLLVGLAYLVFGGYMPVHPVLSVASLTLVLAALFVIEGVLNIVLYFKSGPCTVRSGCWWPDHVAARRYDLFAMAVQRDLGHRILGGVSMMISGFTRIALSSAVRRATIPPAGVSKLAA